MIDIIFKTVNLSYLEKLQIKQNVKNLMFQVIFIFSDWIFDKVNHSFLYPFLLLKEKDFQNIFNLGFWVGNQCIFSECEHHKFNFFSTHGEIY